MEPVSTGNIKRCYKVDNYAVLVGGYSQSSFEDEKIVQEIFKSIKSKGELTPNIYEVIKDGENIIIQHYVDENTLYFRHDQSYCLQKKIRQPINYTFFVEKLKDEFNKSKNYSFTEIMNFQ